MRWQCLNSIVEVSALCADVEPQARRYTKLRRYQWAGRVQDKNVGAPACRRLSSGSLGGKSSATRRPVSSTFPSNPFVLHPDPSQTFDFLHERPPTDFEGDSNEHTHIGMEECGCVHFTNAAVFVEEKLWEETLRGCRTIKVERGLAGGFHRNLLGNAECNSALRFLQAHVQPFCPAPAGGAQDENLHPPGRAGLLLCPEFLGGAAALPYR